MAQDGPHGQRGAAAANGDGSAQRGAVFYTLMSDGEDSNDGSGSEIPPVAADASRGDGVVLAPPAAAVVVNGGEGGSARASPAVPATMSKGKRPAPDAAADGEGKSRGKGWASDGDAAAIAAGDAERAHIITERERRKKMKTMFGNLQALLPHVPERSDKATVVAEAIAYIKALEGTVVKLEQRKREIALARQAAAAEAMAGAGSSSSPLEPHAAQAAAVLAAPVPLPHGHGWGGAPRQHQHQQRQLLPAAAAAARAAPPAGLAPVTAGPVGFQSWSGPNVVLSVSNDDAYISVCAPRRAGVLTLVLAVLDKYGIDIVTTQVSCDGLRSMFTIHGRVMPRASNQVREPPISSEDIFKLAVSEIMVWLSS
ncbi:hypothetical protein ACP4OV_005852 [Aristida adscensionis]